MNPKHTKILTELKGKTLTPEEETVAKEIIYRESWPISIYEPHKIQEAFHKSNKPVRTFFGGNRTGKTMCGAAEVVYFALNDHPYKEIEEGIQIWACCPSTELQTDSIQAALMKFLPPGEIGKIYYERMGRIREIQLKNGSIITLKSYEQGDEKFQSAAKRLIWFDEEPPFEIYEECFVRREAGKPMDIIITMTPKNGLTWIYDEIYLNIHNNPNIEYFIGTWDDNPHLPEEQKQELLRGLDDDAIQVRKFGRFVRRSNTVYSMKKEHLIEDFWPDDKWVIYRSFDFGFSTDHPFCALWHAVDETGKVITFQELYMRNAGYEDIIERVNEMSAGLGRVQTTVDRESLREFIRCSYADTARPDWIAEFNKAGIYVLPAIKDVELGVAKVMEFMLPEGDGIPRWRVDTRCRELRKQMENYHWTVKKSKTDRGKNVPEKKDDDGPDALRYFIYSWINPQVEVDFSQFEDDRPRNRFTGY